MERRHNVILGIFILSAVPQVAMATNCPDAGVVVVASVLTTLAVVLLVFAIAGLFIWKRRRAISKPVTIKNVNGMVSGPSSPNGKHGHYNHAFDKDPEWCGTGDSSRVPCKDNSVDQAKPNCFGSRDLAKKTWSSLPGDHQLDVSIRKRSSGGSLDRNNYIAEEDTLEVWLRSQDFIGLGFNISGSMRDGIFVRTVHKRGPAREAGIFSVGDRIMGVFVSFENIVYEDALTILSYASPYPVKISLQKQQGFPKNRKLSDVTTNLIHPMYRSYSLDSHIPRQRDRFLDKTHYASEVRKDKRDSARVRRESKYRSESNVIEESVSNASVIGSIERLEQQTKQVDAMMHTQPLREHVKPTFVREPVATDLSDANVDLNYNLKNHHLSDSALLPVNSRFADAFGDLSEEDKLDVLRLTYSDPSPHNTEIKPTTSSSDLKCAPLKPERKKKRSSSASLASQSDCELSSMTCSTVSLDSIDSMHEQRLVQPIMLPPPVPKKIREETVTSISHMSAMEIKSDNVFLEPDIATTNNILNIDNKNKKPVEIDLGNNEHIVKSVNHGSIVDSDDHGSIVIEEMLEKQLKMKTLENFPNRQFSDDNEIDNLSIASSSNSTGDNV